MAIIELDQSCETPITAYQRGAFRIRYTYARAKDARLSNLRGEDYLAFRAEPDTLAFVICDGVGSSFFGGLAAQILGERLLFWMWQDATRTLLAGNNSEETILSALRKFLDQQVPPASQVIDQKDISGLPNQFVRKAYQEKKEKHGSQSNFVCGLVNIKSHYAWLFNLGDATLRVWEADTELSLGFARTSEQSWSTRHGISGDLHFRAMNLGTIDTIIAYSDGFNSAEQNLSSQTSADILENYISDLGNDPKSDDISYIEIHIQPDYEASSDDIVSMVRGPLTSSNVPISPKLPESTDMKLQENKNSGWRWVKSGIVALVFFSVGVLIGFFSHPVIIKPPISTSTATLAIPTSTHSVTPTTSVTPSPATVISETPTTTPEYGFPQPTSNTTVTSTAILRKISIPTNTSFLAPTLTETTSPILTLSPTSTRTPNP